MTAQHSYEHVFHRATPDAQEKTDGLCQRTTAASLKQARALALPQSRGLRDSAATQAAPRAASRGRPRLREQMRVTLLRPRPARDRAPRAQGAPPRAPTRSPSPQAQGADTGQCRGGGGGETWSPPQPRAPTFSRAIFFLPQPSHVRGNLGQVWWCACKGRGGCQEPRPGVRGGVRGPGPGPVWTPSRPREGGAACMLPRHATFMSAGSRVPCSAGS